MGFESELLTLMSQTCQIAPVTGRNSYGVRTFGANVGHKCHLTFKNTLARNTQGEELTSTTQAWVPGNSTGLILGTENRFTLPDGTVREILSVDRFWDESNAQHHVRFNLE